MFKVPNLLKRISGHLHTYVTKYQTSYIILLYWHIYSSEMGYFSTLAWIRAKVEGVSKCFADAITKL